MPYVDQATRERLDTSCGPHPQTAGELNYVLTRLCIGYLVDKKLTYALLNEVMGVMSCARAEFYRRVVVPYEQVKCDENGDVYA